MARKPRTIKNIKAQVERAIKSISEGNENGMSKYTRGQYDVARKVVGSKKVFRPEEISGIAAVIANNKYQQRIDEIISAGRRLTRRLQAKGKMVQAARKAQGLSAG